MSSEYPVFYDRTGNRLTRLIVAALAVVALLGGTAASMAPAVLAAPGGHAASTDEGWARRALSGADKLPAIGEGVLTRMDSVDRTTTPWGLFDQVTGEFVRDVEEWEVAAVGDSPMVVEHFAQPADGVLMLTFDDGPEYRWTQEILDILSREHVPATFFVVGRQVVKYPDIVARMVREGHMVANHTFSHINFDDNGDWRNQHELFATDRAIRAAAGYETRLFRMPYGNPDEQYLAGLQSQQLGYLHADFDMDTRDWEYPPGVEIPVPELDGKGHVMIMHDAGGHSRAETVALVEKVIHEAKAKGYTFATMAPLIPAGHQPMKIAPGLVDRLTLLAAELGYKGPGIVLNAVFWFGVGAMLLLTGLYLLLSAANERRQRARWWRFCPDKRLPFVSVIVAAYNEDKVVERTLDALRASDYPESRFEVVAVNDGSTDNTLAVLNAYGWDRLKVVDQVNSGKSSAINNGVNNADDEATVIITMDADTLFYRDTIRKLARHFIGHSHGKKQVGAVAGHVRVGNRNNVLTAWQSLEYLNGISIIRMAEMMVGAVGIVPGACSAWRRSALEEIGGFSEDTLAEDADAAMTFQRLGYAVIHDNHALCDTEAPETIVPLLKQRKRWMFGNFQVMWKNRSMLFRPKYGVLGMVTMPYAVAQLLLNLLFLPVLTVLGIVAIAQGDWRPAVAFGLVVLAMHMVTGIAAVLISREKWWHLMVVPIYRPIYEAMRIYLLYATAYRVLKGAEFSWDKLERRNSVVSREKEIA